MIDLKKKKKMYSSLNMLKEKTSQLPQMIKFSHDLFKSKACELTTCATREEKQNAVKKYNVYECQVGSVF